MLTHVVIHHQNFIFINTIIDVTEKFTDGGFEALGSRNKLSKIQVSCQSLYILIVVTNNIIVFFEVEGSVYF